MDLKIIYARLRVRISTAFLLIAILTMPMAIIWAQLSHIPNSVFTLNKYSLWIFSELPKYLYLFAFISAFITAVVLAIRRNWGNVVQCLIEMVISIPLFLSYAVSY